MQTFTLRRRVVVVALLTVGASAFVAQFAGGSHAASPVARTSAGTSGCGFERWPVKTLADTGAAQLRLTNLRATTISHLWGLTVAQGGQSSRGGTAERTEFRVHAYLLAAKVEADSDIHLEIADPVSGKTMIAELPLLGCTRGATAAARKIMQRARTRFLTACGDPGADVFTQYRPMTKATIAGVGFFDFKHGQRGVAKNGIELHPVTAISVTGCR